MKTSMASKSLTLLQPSSLPIFCACVQLCQLEARVRLKLQQAELTTDQLKGRPQTTQILLGRSAFATAFPFLLPFLTTETPGRGRVKLALS